MLKGPKRSFVVLVVGVETCVKNATNGAKNLTKNVPKGTKNAREQNSFLIKRKMFAKKVASN